MTQQTLCTTQVPPATSLAKNLSQIRWIGWEMPSHRCISGLTNSFTKGSKYCQCWIFPSGPPILKGFSGINTIVLGILYIFEIRLCWEWFYYVNGWKVLEKSAILLPVNAPSHGLRLIEVGCMVGWLKLDGQQPFMFGFGTVCPMSAPSY